MQDSYEIEGSNPKRPISAEPGPDGPPPTVERSITPSDVEKLWLRLARARPRNLRPEKNHPQADAGEA